MTIRKSDHIMALIVAGIVVQLFIYHYKEWRDAQKQNNLIG